MASSLASSLAVLKAVSWFDSKDTSLAESMAASLANQIAVSLASSLAVQMTVSLALSLADQMAASLASSLAVQNIGGCIKWIHSKSPSRHEIQYLDEMAV